MNNKIKIEEAKITYSQEADSCDGSDMLQSLTISTQNAGAEDYFIISTERWAFDSIDEFINLFEDFKRRFVNNHESNV